MTWENMFELRERLKENGIEWSSDYDDNGETTFWKSPNGQFFNCSHEGFSHNLDLYISHVTPEQAIAATLGSETYEREITKINDEADRLAFELGKAHRERDDLKREIVRLREQIETLVTVLEFEGIVYRLDYEGNQYFDYGNVKDHRAKQIAEEVAKCLSENWKDVPANPSGFGMKLSDEEIEEVVKR